MLETQRLMRGTLLVLMGMVIAAGSKCDELHNRPAALYRQLALDPDLVIIEGHPAGPPSLARSELDWASLTIYPEGSHEYL